MGVGKVGNRRQNERNSKRMKEETNDEEKKIFFFQFKSASVLEYLVEIVHEAAKRCSKQERWKNKMFVAQACY